MNRAPAQQPPWTSRRFQLTETGQGILIGTVFVLLTCLVIPAFGILAGLMVLQAVALGIGWWFRPRLRLQGNWPEQAVTGQTIRAQFTLTNPSRVPVYQLWMEPLPWPQEFEPEEKIWPVASLAPGESRTVTLAATCLRRGCYQLESPVCTSSFPFNLYRFGPHAAKPQEVLILPAYRRLERPVLASAASMGSRLGQARRWAGSSPEYVGSRPFIPGDSPRRIDARAWARLSVPAVKEFFDESKQAVALVMDTSSGASGRTLTDPQRHDFEGAVSLAASLAYSLPRHATLNTLAVDTEIHTLVGENLSLQVEQVLRLLATVTPDAQPRVEEGDTLADLLSQVQELLIVGIAWHARTLHLAELAQQQGCPVTMIRVGADSPNLDSISVPGVPIHRIAPSVLTLQEAELPW